MIELTQRDGLARVGHAGVAHFVVGELRLDVGPRAESGAGFRLLLVLGFDEPADAVAAVPAVEVLVRLRRREQVVREVARPVRVVRCARVAATLRHLVAVSGI